MKKMYLVTDVYPYGEAEKTFIRPELDKLIEKFDVTIISCGDADEMIDNAYLKDRRINVVKYNRKKGVFASISLTYKTLVSNVFWDEVIRILGKREQVWARIKSSFFFVKEAICFKTWVKRTKLACEGELYYTYWYYAHTLGLVMLKEETSIKLITRTHGYDLHNQEAKGNRQCCKEYMDNRLNSIAFISQEGLNYYLEHNNIKKSDRHCLYYLGAPKSKLPECQLSVDNRTDAFNVVSCGSLIWWKHIDLIIDALSLISDLKINWIHYGDGELKQNLTEMAQEKLGNKDNIRYCFRGFVDREVIYDDYGENRINCYILCSYLEGLPVSNMEALANGIPIITTDVGGCYETVRENGVLLSSNPTPVEVKEAIEYLNGLSEREYIDKRINSYNLWKERFDVNKNMEQYAEYVFDLNESI